VPIFTNPSSIIIVSSILSAFLLTFLAVAFARLKAGDKNFWKKIPDLDNKWIAISLLPILLALFYSGYLKSFKGFGVEIEIQNTTISAAGKDLKLSEIENLVGKQVAVIERKQPTKTEAKKQLDRLNAGQLKSINVLLLRDGVRYENGAIREYLTRLVNLKYIEITNKNDDFIYLLPVSTLDINNRSLIKKFTDALAQRQVFQNFPRDTIYESVDSSDSLLTLAEKFSKSKSDHFPVTEMSKLKYIISAKDVVNALYNILKGPEGSP
jgi:hypothetical protein